MPFDAVRTVYTVANDMDLMQAFYQGALELPLAFRDRDNWCQFKTGQVSFALSSPSEAADAARGSVIVFDAIDVAVFAQRIERLGACPNSGCSILSEFDLSLGYEQVFSSLEYRSDAAAAAECAGFRAERPCVAVYR